MELLANYTVYDFELTNNTGNSFRYVSMRDSISIYLLKNISLSSNNIVRYYESGSLDWKNFAESPQISNF